MKHFICIVKSCVEDVSYEPLPYLSAVVIVTCIVVGNLVGR